MALRQGGDRLAAQLTAGGRLLLALAGVVALVAAARIAVVDNESEASGVQATWLVACTAVAALCFVALFAHPSAWLRRDPR